eukprot:6188295-Pleurochrysis_carterae.AAC.1
MDWIARMVSAPPPVAMAFDLPAAIAAAIGPLQQHQRQIRTPQRRACPRLCASPAQASPL